MFRTARDTDYLLITEDVQEYGCGCCSIGVGELDTSAYICTREEVENIARSCMERRHDMSASSAERLASAQRPLPSNMSFLLLTWRLSDDLLPFSLGGPNIL
jgi:hypothetical protein